MVKSMRSPTRTGFGRYIRLMTSPPPKGVTNSVSFPSGSLRITGAENSNPLTGDKPWPRYTANSEVMLSQNVQKSATITTAQFAAAHIASCRDPDAPITLSAGDRIAQLRIVKKLQATFEEVDDLDATHRGEGGFGSTGHN